MLNLNDRQRDVLTDKLPDTANVVMAGAVFGQAVSGQGFSTALALGGLMLWAGLMTWSMLLARRSDR